MEKCLCGREIVAPVVSFGQGEVFVHCSWACDQENAAEIAEFEANL